MEHILWRSIRFSKGLYHMQNLWPDTLTSGIQIIHSLVKELMHPSVMKELNYMLLGAFPGGTSGKKNKKKKKQKKKPSFQCRRQMQVRYLGWEDSSGERHGNPLQYSCLENSMDRRAWWATVHGVAKSQTWLTWLSMHAGLFQIGNVLEYFFPLILVFFWGKKSQ